MDYTARINGFQIRDTSYLPGYESEKPQREFDIVKWEQHSPYEITDLITGEKKISTESCYSIGELVWDEHEQDFEFRSIGLRWLDAEVPMEFCRIVKAFVEFKAMEYREVDNGNIH